MSGPGDAMGPARLIASGSASADATASAQSPPPVDGAADDHGARRTALRELAAMIGAEVFY